MAISTRSFPDRDGSSGAPAPGAGGACPTLRAARRHALAAAAALSEKSSSNASVSFVRASSTASALATSSRTSCQRFEVYIVTIRLQMVCLRASGSLECWLQSNVASDLHTSCVSGAPFSARETMPCSSSELSAPTIAASFASCRSSFTSAVVINDAAEPTSVPRSPSFTFPAFNRLSLMPSTSTSLKRCGWLMARFWPCSRTKPLPRRCSVPRCCVNLMYSS
mmetsp:Transcript_21340/g.66130  ORF Transcript_21340/g.66130 Transcript_21340/m.66130 type:complete len:223 (-) Transcript_21340:1029-1697(-)